MSPVLPVLSEDLVRRNVALAGRLRVGTPPDVQAVDDAGHEGLDVDLRRSAPVGNIRMVIHRCQENLSNKLGGNALDATRAAM